MPSLTDALSFDPLRALRESVRKILYRTAKTHILVIGDSHVRVFEHWRMLWEFPRTRFEVVYAPGGTAFGITNRASKSGAYSAFLEALANLKHDLVVVNLGEVDTAYMLWRRAENSEKTVSELMAVSVRNYCRFLDKIQKNHPVVVLSACLPTLADHADSKDEVSKVRMTVKASQKERTALALEFNARVAEFCSKNDIPYLNCAAVALGANGIVRRQWVNRKRFDHHYARAPYAQWLAKELKKLNHPAGIKLR